MTTTAVGMRCPECARQRTQVRTARSLAGEPILTYVLIAINVAAFVGAWLTGAGPIGGGLHASLITQEGALSGPTLADGQVWRLVTAGFLHAGFLHLAFNMLALWVLGSILEPVVGRTRFALLYAVSLLSGSFGAILLDPSSFTVGASGAVFGLMGAALVVMRNRGISPMESGLALWLGLNLVITLAVPGISIGGHFGGLVGGTLAALLLFELGDRFRFPRALSATLAAAIGAVAVAGALVLAGA
jgi:membrane associated rhomboid family serine protease